MPKQSPTSPAFPAATTEFRSSLRAWYAAHRRDLPWRRERSLYRTVVSEFMLQQTRVETVLLYFERWMRDLPDFRALAAAPENQVLKLWEGLGYYSRVRNLHTVGKLVSGMDPVPADPASWLKFPGVGPYTAAAITSISFGAPAACVDGNVVRILARLTADASLYPTSGHAVKKYQPLAEELLDRSDPGLHNEAMMELGATVCMRREPNCPACPVRSVCKAHKTGSPDRYPRFVPKRIEKQEVVRVWCRDNKGCLLLHRKQPNAKRLAGLWELPTAAQVNLAPEEIEARAPLLLRVKRSITRFSITESIFAVSDPGNMVTAIPGLYWKNADEIGDLTFSGPHRRWVEQLLHEEMTKNK